MVTTVSNLIDLMHLGRDRVIGAYDIDGIVVDPGPTSCVEKLLAETRPRVLLLTHIHLDHAGATGTLVSRFPDIQVYVHERGIPHLVDPEKLLRSAARLYGDDMERLWGDVVPVPEQNLHALRGGELVEGFEVAYTPGHASHHVSYFNRDSGEAYVGDVGGVRIPPVDFTVAPTPPPDIDIELWRESLEKLAAWEPERICPTHFGPVDDVTRQLARVERSLLRLSGWARELEQESFVEGVTGLVMKDAGAEVAERVMQAAPPDQIFLGLERYWSKRAEAEVT
jgi:glyoxylase-like metal-dependent hydrolase (beta-lactamase superfamily II)